MKKPAASLLLAIALAAAPRPARADVPNLVPLIAVGGAIAVACLAADVTFTAHDAMVAGRDELPTHGWSTAEMVVTAPQMLLLNGGLAAVASRPNSQVLQLALVFPAVWTTSLTTHGIWGLATDEVRPYNLLGVSPAIGANTTFTTVALVSAIQGKLPTPALGVAQMVLTLPQTIAGTYQAVTHERERDLWIGLAAWSGALFLHGTAAVIWGPRRPPPETDDASLFDPARLQLGPTVVSDGIARVPGVAAFGRF